MPKYFDDCSALTAWGERGFSGSAQFSISGGAITTSGTAAEALELTAVNSDIDRQDVEILFKIKIASITTTHWVGIVRGTDSGTQSSMANYYVAIRGTALRTYYKLSGGSAQQIGTAPKTHSNDTYYWVRLRVDISTVQAKSWADGAAEPAAWDLDNTDSNVTGDGFVGLYKDATNTTITRAAFGAATASDTAPGLAANPRTLRPRFPMPILNF